MNIYKIITSKFVKFVVLVNEMHEEKFLRLSLFWLTSISDHFKSLVDLEKEGCGVRTMLRIGSITIMFGL